MLIILAGVSINLVVGNNGIITIAKRAKENIELAQIEGEKKLNELYLQLEAETKGGSSGNIDSETGGSSSEDKDPETGGSSSEDIDPEAGWDLDKVNKITSEDNVVVPVPKGYVASTVEGEKSVATGFVIKEGNDGSKTEGINEFVWVPVENISDIYDEANNAGQLWDFSGTTSTKKTYPTEQNSGAREPDVVTSASEGSDSTSGTEEDAVSTNLQQAGLSETATASDFKKQLQKEFNEMINSVKTYRGFYIGRYETGNLSTVKAVVQKNNSDIESQTWYTQYKVCKTIKANENVTTSMIVSVK